MKIKTKLVVFIYFFLGVLHLKSAATFFSVQFVCFH